MTFEVGAIARWADDLKSTTLSGIETFLPQAHDERIRLICPVWEEPESMIWIRELRLLVRETQFTDDPPRVFDAPIDPPDVVGREAIVQQIEHSGTGLTCNCVIKSSPGNPRVRELTTSSTFIPHRVTSPPNAIRVEHTLSSANLSNRKPYLRCDCTG